MARLEEKLAAHAQRRASVPATSDAPQEARRLLLVPTEEMQAQRDTLTEIPLHQIEPDPNQPRKELGDLEDLKASIKAVGLAQPIVVRIVGFERYQILMGERRYTAVKELGLVKIPAIVRASLEEHQRLELQIVENLHRKDLNPLEEAESYKRLMDVFGHTQEALGARLGKSQNSISETLKLLKLPETLQAQYRTSDIVSKSLLLEIAKQPTETAQMTMWEQAKRGELTVKAARAQKRETKKTASRTPRAMAFRYPIQTELALVTVTFNEARVDQQSIIDALEEALAQERERLVTL